MAKAEKERIRRLPAVTVPLSSFSPALQELFRELKQKSLTARADAERAREFARRIDRAIGIEMGLIAPPWMQQQQQAKTADGWQVARVKKVLLEYFPEGRPPLSLGPKAIAKILEPGFEKRGWKPPGRDSVARALGRRRR